MPNKQKIKGVNFEREFIKKCKEHNLEAKRAWGSRGVALGEADEVDCIVEGYRIQCKKGYNHPSIKLKEFLTKVDICIWSPSDCRKHPNSDYVFMSVDMLLQLLGHLKEYKKTLSKIVILG